MLKWTDDLSTRVEEIDSQHKELFRRVNDLLSAMSQGKGKDEVARVLTFLSDYVVIHFGTEERIMRERGYPGFERHRQEHKSYTDKLSALRTRFGEQGTNSLMAIQAQSLLTEWWFSHINVTDKALGAFLTQEVTYGSFPTT